MSVSLKPVSLNVLPEPQCCFSGQINDEDEVVYQEDAHGFRSIPRNWFSNLIEYFQESRVESRRRQTWEKITRSINVDIGVLSQEVFRLAKVELQKEENQPLLVLAYEKIKRTVAILKIPYFLAYEVWKRGKLYLNSEKAKQTPRHLTIKSKREIKIININKTGLEGLNATICFNKESLIHYIKDLFYGNFIDKEMAKSIADRVFRDREFTSQFSSLDRLILKIAVYAKEESIFVRQPNNWGDIWKKLAQIPFDQLKAGQINRLAEIGSRLSKVIEHIPGRKERKSDRILNFTNLSPTRRRRRTLRE